MLIKVGFQNAEYAKSLSNFARIGKEMWRENKIGHIEFSCPVSLRIFAGWSAGVANGSFEEWPATADPPSIANEPMLTDEAPAAARAAVGIDTGLYDFVEGADDGTSLRR